MTMLDHGILRTAITFSSTASCVAVAPRTRWMYCTSGETSGRCISRIAAFLMLLSETVTFGARFVHHDGLPVHVLAVERGDRCLRFGVAGELDEGKAFRCAGDAILDYFRRGRGAVRLHDLAELRIIDVPGQISKIDFHGFAPALFGGTLRAAQRKKIVC